jgi:cardiolipin synthase C
MKTSQLPFRFAAIAASAMLAACAQLPPRRELPADAALPPGTGAPLDGSIGTVEAAHPGESGLRLVAEGPEAFAVRVRSAQLAQRSLDVQTYIWHADLTGLFLAQQLLEAADRGVRVRLLVDDVDARPKNLGMAALDSHDRIEVRSFNPFASRKGTMSQVGEGVSSLERLNHRMHNKTWIADNRVALAGGRNLGNEYFDASEDVNFNDLDFAMVGPVVRDASASFDRYWNSASAYPMDQLDPDNVNAQALATLRTKLATALEGAQESEYAVELRGNDAVQRLVAGDWPLVWTRTWRFIADEPDKMTLEPGPARSRVLTELVPAIRGTSESLRIMSPYFVPGDAGTELLVAAARPGVEVEILTNSLAANDVPAVHGGYARHRGQLVAGGIALYEMKPRGESPHTSGLAGSSGGSLHTKALSIDDRVLFVGSYNLDPRSTQLNCEQGTLVESPELARQFAAMFERQTAPDHAWRVTLDDGELAWSGEAKRGKDPAASGWRKFQAWLARALHLDAQL